MDDHPMSAEQRRTGHPKDSKEQTMGTVYTTTLTADETTYLRETLAGNANYAVSVWGQDDEPYLTVALSEAAVRYLETLPADADGHVDDDGNLWIGGVDNALTVIHNA
jgi:hypothetical protein